MLYKEILRKYVEEGQGYSGMIIYANFEVYKELNPKLKKSHKKTYDSLIQKIKKGEKVEVYTEVDEGRIYVFIAVPIKKMQNKEYMNRILNLCQKLCIDGPVVYIQ